MPEKLSRRNLSAKLDDLIEFRAGFISPENIEKIFGGSQGAGNLVGGMRSRLAGLATRGTNPAIAGPRVMGALSSEYHPDVQRMFQKFAAARSAANPAVRTPIEGAVKSAATGGYGATNPFSGIRSLLPRAGAVAQPASARLAAASPSAAQAVAEKAGQAVGAAKAGVSNIAKYGATAGLAAGGGLAAGALLASRRKPEEEQLNLILDNLIEFAYPEAVMKTVWDRIKKPSRQTLGGILRRHDPRSSIPTMVFRNQTHMMAVKDYSTKYPKEVLETVWKKLKKPRKPSPYAQSYHSGEYHDDPKWVNKDIKKSRRDARGLSVRLDEVIQFADPRPRNPLGEFTGQQGGPDANAMATVYKMPQQQPQQQGGIPGTAATLLAGGALGAVGANIGKTGYDESVKLIKHLAAKRKVLKLK